MVGYFPASMLQVRGFSFFHNLSDGSVLEGYVHPDWISTKIGLKVTAMDLKSAYK